MLCEQCGKKEATVHWTEVVNDAVRKMHLCHACASAKGLNVLDPGVLTNVLLGMGSEPKSGCEGRNVCPSCRMRLSDFKKTSRLGCPVCYSAFADELKPLIEAVHKCCRHAGKKPPAASQKTGRFSPEALRKKLAESIAAENYEEAALLRDSLRRCEGVGKAAIPLFSKEKDENGG